MGKSGSPRKSDDENYRNTATYAGERMDIRMGIKSNVTADGEVIQIHVIITTVNPTWPGT